MLFDLSGPYDVCLSDQSTWKAVLPGTLDENRIGGPDEENLSTRLTRVCTYEGPAAFSRIFDAEVPEGRLFLEVERARKLSLEIDGTPVAPVNPVTLSSASVFEVTGVLKKGSRITFISDNSYPGWPHDNIVYSSAATDETQTNWNGLLGYIRLRSEEQNFIERVRVYPERIADGSFQLDVQVDLDLAEPYEGMLKISSPVLEEKAVKVDLEAGRHTCVFSALPVKKEAAAWDEYEGHLQTLTVSMDHGGCREATFGLRTFAGNEEGRLALNGRVLFIRSEANCCEFPEIGHGPMTVTEWKKVLLTYKSYGINCMRFHSHCPSEAAFYAADELGMLMQPELSHWNPRTAFESDEARDYYFTEALAIVKELANHPSFVMLTFGNELWAGDLGHARMHELLHMLQEYDATRLYADGSNVHYGQIGCDPESDFYASQKYFGMDLRGTFGGPGISGFINEEYPSAMHNYSDTMEELRKTYKKPVFSFEVGQFEVLPDFDELAQFQGVRRPVNLEIVRQRVEEKGLAPRWKEYVEATGEVSLLSYKAEIEAVLRTPEMSGISLLGLQDFTGQGTALVGMLNSHLQSKPFDFARPEHFHEFFNDVVPLALLPKYTYTEKEAPVIPVAVANYGKGDLSEAISYELLAEGKIIAEGSWKADCPQGRLSQAGEIRLQGIGAGRYDLVLHFDQYQNRYPLWIYPEQDVNVPENVHVARTLDEAAQKVLAEGGRVFLCPPADKNVLPHSIRNQFTTDFWSVGTFKAQEGGMSFLIDKDHPAFKNFPTENHSNWQWWAMSNGLGIIVPDRLQSIVIQMDSYAYLRSMTALFEARVGEGKLMFCSMGLLENTQDPEVRALLNSLFAYMSGEEFRPAQELSVEEILQLFA